MKKNSSLMDCFNWFIDSTVGPNFWAILHMNTFIRQQRQQNGNSQLVTYIELII